MQPKPTYALGMAQIGRGATANALPHTCRAFQRCYVAANGDVVLRFHKTDIVRIKQSGDVLLYCGGYFTATTMWSMNDALQFINVTVSELFKCICCVVSRS